MRKQRELTPDERHAARCLAQGVLTSIIGDRILISTCSDMRYPDPHPNPDKQLDALFRKHSRGWPRHIVAQARESFRPWAGIKGEGSVRFRTYKERDAYLVELTEARDGL